MSKKISVDSIKKPYANMVGQSQMQSAVKEFARENPDYNPEVFKSVALKHLNVSGASCILYKEPPLGQKLLRISLIAKIVFDGIVFLTTLISYIIAMVGGSFSLPIDLIMITAVLVVISVLMLSVGAKKSARSPALYYSKEYLLFPDLSSITRIKEERFFCIHQDMLKQVTYQTNYEKNGVRFGEVRFFFPAARLKYFLNNTDIGMFLEYSKMAMLPAMKHKLQQLSPETAKSALSKKRLVLLAAVMAVAFAGCFAGVMLVASRAPSALNYGLFFAGLALTGIIALVLCCSLQGKVDKATIITILVGTIFFVAGWGIATVILCNMQGNFFEALGKATISGGVILFGNMGAFILFSSVISTAIGGRIEIY